MHRAVKSVCRTQLYCIVIRNENSYKCFESIMQQYIEVLRTENMHYLLAQAGILERGSLGSRVVIIKMQKKLLEK